MATIDEVTFNLSTITFNSVPRNVRYSTPGYDSSPITNMGHEGLIIQVKGYETDGDTYDSVVNAFLSEGVKELIIRTGWKYKVHSVRHNITEDGGFADNYFPYNFELITSEPYQYSVDTNYRSVEITSDEQTWSAEDKAYTLVRNWTFDSWNSGADNDPDHWITGGTGTINKEEVEYKHGLISAKVTCTTTEFYLYQDYYPRTLDTGDVYSVGFWVKAETSSSVQVYLKFIGGTGGEESAVTTETIGTSWTFMEVSGTVSASDHTHVQIRVDNNTDATDLYVDGGILQNESSIDSSTFDRTVTTTGIVSAVPDIRVTAGEGVGYGGTGSTNQEHDPTLHSTGSTSYVLASTQTHTAVAGKALKLTDSQYYHWGSGTLNGGWSRHTIKLTIQATSYNGGVETIVYEHVHYNSVNSKETSSYEHDITVGHNEDMVLRFYHYRTPSYDITSNIDEIKTDTEEQTLVILDGVQVFNTDDPTVKCDISGEMHPDTEVRINTDGTGTYRYLDDFKTNKCVYDTYAYSGTYSETNDRFEMPNSGYLEYRFETLYPITGIPTFDALIDITAGTPTIKIAEDSSGSSGTYYDIDDAIVDNVYTKYELDNVASISLKGKTVFWVKIICDVSATCHVYNFRLDGYLVTVDAEHPFITSGTNEFQCDQTSTAAIACTVDLIFNDRKWAR